MNTSKNNGNALNFSNNASSNPFESISKIIEVDSEELEKFEKIEVVTTITFYPKKG